MNKDEIQSKIESFVGNLSNSFSFIGSINDDLKIDFSNIVETSDPLSKYITFTRHLITKSVITRPEKSGRSLLLTGQDILQIMVAKKYLNMGITINLLSTGYIANLTTQELLQRLFTDQLTDISDIQNLHTSAVAPKGNSDTDDSSVQGGYQLFKRIKINDEMELNVLDGSYDDKVLKRIQNYLKKQSRL